MGSKQHHFVLVHGAGHGAWCWVKVVAALEKAGHRATTVDLSSAGENDDSADDITSLEQYNYPLENLLRAIPDNEKVILVGHSLGGMSVSLASEQFPKKLSVGVYLSAFMPGPELHFGRIPAADPESITRSQEIIYHCKVEGGPVTSFEFPIKKLRSDLYNRCSAEDFSFASERCKRFPDVNCIFAGFPNKVENWKTVPRVYILATEDRVIIPARAQTMVTLNPPNEVFEIDADHSPFFSAVEELAKLLNGIAAKYDS